jgi:signal transduction histidine kinase
VQFTGPIHDPACGEGRIVIAAQRAGYEATGGDLIDRGFGETGVDFLTDNRPRTTLVFNAPYKQNEAFIPHVLEIASHVIETANIRATNKEPPAEVVGQDCVLVSLRDTGTGISPEIIERAFEPFFTTKEMGKGTGLGLSMVFGVVRQSGGAVRIRSRLREGTTVQIYLPRTIETDLRSAVHRGRRSHPDDCGRSQAAWRQDGPLARQTGAAGAIRDPAPLG